MALTGNKGEWSEIYTLLKLLGEGKVYAGDQHMNKIHDLFYPIIMILRQEKEGNFNYKLQDRDVVIQTPEGCSIVTSTVLASMNSGLFCFAGSSSVIKTASSA